MSEVIDISFGVTSSGLWLIDSQIVNVLSGGTAIAISLLPRFGMPQFTVFSGGSAIGDSAEQGASLVILSGGTASGDILDPAGSEIVIGTAISTTAIFLGLQVVSGLAIDTQIDAGTQTVESGGTAIGTTVIGGDGIPAGSQTVSSGGVASDTLFGSGSLGIVSSGGTALDFTLQSSSTLMDEGTAIGTTVQGGGTAIIGDPSYRYDPVSAPIAVASDTVVVSGGSLLVVGGGTAIETVVSSGGTMDIGDPNYLYEPPLQPSIAVASQTVISGGSVRLWGDGTIADGISFVGGGGYLYISGTWALSAPVSGFGLTDRIDFTEMDYTSAATVFWDSSTGVLTLSNGYEVPFSVQLAGDYTGAVFGLSSDGFIGTEVTVLSMPCFAAGTRILTERGEVAVEQLAIGDRVMTIEGKAQPITWIGHRRIDCRRHPEPEKVWPVRIKAHAFGENRPQRDLLLSPDHAVFAEDVLIPVKQLINEVSLQQIAMAEVTYFHLELDRHAVILAEGLPAESYLDTGDRGAFGNAAQPTVLHPAFGAERADIGLVLEAFGYAPLRVTGPEVAAVKAHLAARLAADAPCRAGSDPIS